MIRLAWLLLLPTMGLAGSLEPAGQIRWEMELPEFGGFSGIEVRADGSFLAISDRGHFFEGMLTRENGRLTGVEYTNHTPVLDTKGSPLDGRNTDAEGIAISPDGIYLSFEGNHRIMRHSSPQSAANFLPKHPDFRVLQNNSGLEALAIDALGALYAIPERSGKLDRPFPIYRFDGAWEKVANLPRRGEFLIVGADFGPDGRFYVLERDFTWLGGFSTRIRRFSLAGARLGDEETLLATTKGVLDNMEGISVWVDASGKTRLTLVSDDNFNLLQHTLLIEYVVHE